jgi:hypothetical protein
MRAALVGFGIGALCAYALFAIVGVTTQSIPGSPIGAMSAEATLVFAFPTGSAEGGQWHSVSGTARHGWLLRHAYVEGNLDSISGVLHSEQVLKVGWPFTVVRGFIRTVGSEVEREGARLVGRADPGQPVRLLPTQPVWPGVVLYGFLGMVGATRFRSRRGDSRASANASQDQL